MRLKLQLPEELDEIDIGIVRLLQNDSRLSFHKIASRLGISVGTAYNRIKSLEGKGVLKRYTAIVDPSKLGFTMTVLVLIQAEGAHLVEVENEIAKISNELNSEQFDFLAELTPYHTEARYGDYKENLSEIINETKAQQVFMTIYLKIIVKG